MCRRKLQGRFEEEGKKRYRMYFSVVGALGVTNLNVYVSHACGIVVALDVWVFSA